jgi:hypothetical protein
MLTDSMTPTKWSEMHYRAAEIFFSLSFLPPSFLFPARLSLSELGNPEPNVSIIVRELIAVWWSAVLFGKGEEKTSIRF